MDYRQVSSGTARAVTLFKNRGESRSLQGDDPFLWQSWQKQISAEFQATELWLFLKPIGHPRANMREIDSAFLLFLNLFTLSSPFSELKGSNHHIHFFLRRAGVSLGPGAAAPVTVRGEVPEPADQHLALQVH